MLLENKDLQDLMAQLETRVQGVSSDHEDLQDLPDHLVLLELKDHLDLRETEEHSVHLDHPVQLVPPVLMVRPDQLETSDLQVHLVMRESLACQDYLVLMDKPASLDRKEIPVVRERGVQSDLPA